MRYCYNYKNTFKEFISLMLPTLINFFVYGVLRMTDIILLGSLHVKDAVTVIALSKKICFIPITFLSGFTNALSVIIVRHTLNGNHKRASQSLKETWLFSIICGTGCFLFLFFFPNVFIRRAHQPANVAQLTGEIIPVLAFSIVLITFSMCVRKYLRGLGWIKSASLLNIIDSCTHILFAYLFVHGSLGLPKLGVKALPWAILIGHALSAILSCCILYKLYKKKLIVRIPITQIDTTLLKSILLLGLPLGLQLATSYAYNGFINQAFTGRLDVLTNRIATLIREIEAFFRNMSIAVCVVASILLSRAKESHPTNNYFLIKKVSYVISIATGLLLTLSFYLSYSYFIKVTHPDIFQNAEAMALAKEIAIYTLPLIPLYALQLTSIGLLTGMGKSIDVFCITLGAYLFVGYLLNYLSYHVCHGGIQGVYLSNGITFFVIFCVSNLRLRAPIMRKAKP